jgi:hypothetical protein
VPRQVQLADDLGAQQRDDVRRDGVLEAGIDLLGDRRAAEHVAPLEHEHLAARAGEIRRIDEPVVAAADDDDVVLVHGKPCCVAELTIDPGGRTAAPGADGEISEAGRQRLVRAEEGEDAEVDRAALGRVHLVRILH